MSVPYNTAAADGSGWQAGDVSKLRGYKFLGRYTGPQDNAGLYDWTRPLTGSVTVYAHWQRLQANVIYDANGGTGSHANTTGWQYSDVTIRHVEIVHARRIRLQGMVPQSRQGRCRL